MDIREGRARVGALELAYEDWGDPADPALLLETLVWRLFNEEEEVRALASTPLSRGCRCTGDYIASVLAKFTPEERREMADENGLIQVDCAFCATKFPIPADAAAVA